VFSWFHKKPAPIVAPPAPATLDGDPQSASNPAEVGIGFSNAAGSWTERVNLVQLAAAVLQQHSHATRSHHDWVEHRDSGFLIRPRMVGFQPLDGGGVRTATTIQTSHPALTSANVFEYQHSTGGSIEESVSKGFDHWLQLDFVVLLDALREKPANCMVLELSFPATEAAPARARRAVLGPVAQFRTSPPPAPASQPASAEEHPFCACCMFTNSFEPFRSIVQGEGFHGIRLYAARDENGIPQADCRVNGIDFELGAAALRKYVGTWPQIGFEFRKQYIVLQDVPKSHPV
jgi:hypothetical protein